MSDVDLRACMEVAIHAAREAGTVLQERRHQFDVREKGLSDLVTDVDLAAQDTIRRAIHARFPDHDFLGEEADAQPSGDHVCRWIVDPLDGTTNYVHGHPFYSVSVALEVEGELALGVVYDPNRDECFTATAGRGACADGEAIHVSAQTELCRALLVTGFPADVARSRRNVDHFVAMIQHCQAIRRLGSAALNLAYVACGRLDGYWETSLHPWDAAAGVLFVREAGGQVTRLDGTPYDLYRPELLATNGRIHSAMRRVLSATPS